MRLIPPTESLHRSYLDAVDEFGGAHRDGDGLWQWIDAEGAVQPYTRAEMESDEGFHDFIVRRTDPDRDLLRGWVPCTFLWMEQDGEYVGSLAIRHDLNDFLAAEGGHIGYSVRPSARRRGHATDALRQALPVCRDLGLNRVLLTCDDDNLGSATVIEANGGVLTKTIPAPSNGQLVRHYWIDLSDAPG